MAKDNKNAAKNAKAAARVRAAQQQKRQRMMWSIGIIAIVVVGIGALILAKGSKNDSTANTSTEPTDAPASIATDLSDVPLPAIEAAYAASPPSNAVKPIPDGKVRKVSGKPEVLYMGGQFCPYCAGERWALTEALSKFGEFSDLKIMSSSEGDVPTLSYTGSSYTSDYVTFTPIELADQEHKPLEKATDAQMELLNTLGGGSYPFIDFGGMSYQSGGSVEVQNLIGKDQTEIASTLADSTTSDTDPTSLQGNVNSVTGGFIEAICKVTGDKPAKVCKAAPAS